MTMIGIRGCGTGLLCAVAIALGTAGPSAGADPTLVKDIDQTPSGDAVSTVTPVLGGLLLGARDNTHGRELWRSNGTAAGTVLVKDIAPGPSASNPSGAVEINGVAYFSADDGEHGYELWRTDGSEGGTSMVKEIWPGRGTGVRVNGLAGQAVAIGSILFFIAEDPDHGSELWRSDGTEGGTSMIGDIFPGPAGSAPFILGVAGGRVILSAAATEGDDEVWASDGTSAGTQRLVDVTPGPTGSSPGLIGKIDGALLFGAGPFGQRGLWRTDGTPAGTQQVTAMKATYPVLTEPWDGAIWFAGDDGEGAGRELWRTDGTSAGTALFADLQPGPGHGSPGEGVPIGDKLVFTARQEGAGAVLFSSDGTAAGTIPIADLITNDCSSEFYFLTSFGDRALFRGREGGFGWDVWVTDGTAAGTKRLKDFTPRQRVKFGFDAIAVFDGQAYFSIDDGEHGFELWRTDGTPNGTELFKDILSVTNGALGLPSDDLTAPLPRIGDVVLFNVDGVLWRSDGTAAGTFALPVGTAGRDHFARALATTDGGKLFFSVEDGASIQLWRTDGTVANTAMVTTLTERPEDAVTLGETLFFSNRNVPNGIELWSSDGTQGNTAMLADLATGPGHSRPRGFVRAGAQVFFYAHTLAAGDELWVTNGTPGGTHMVADVNPGAESSIGDFGPPLASGNSVFFTPDDGEHGREVWFSDGSAAGTFLLKDIVPGVFDGILFGTTVWTAAGSRIYFLAGDPLEGITLWRSNGSPAGTVNLGIVQEPETLPPGRPDYVLYFPQQLVEHDGNLFFDAYRADVGVELFRWRRSLGTPRLVKDINPGVLWGHSYSSRPTVYAGRLYFEGRDPEHGSELWETDGTELGTRMVSDIAPGSSSAGISVITATSDQLLFAAADGIHGRELWELGTPDPRLEIEQVRFRPSSDGALPRVIVKARVIGASLDTTEGVSIAVSDSGSLDASGQFSADACDVLPRGLVNCRSTDGRSTLRAYGARGGSGLRAVLRPESVPGDVASPVTVTVVAGDLSITASATCTQRGSYLFCE